MKRKVIELGNQSSVVSLPKKWVQANGLKKGDEIEVAMTDNSLIITTKPGMLKTSKMIALASTHTPYLRSVIASAYKAGYDEIILQFAQTQAPKIQDINEIINSFTGLEVVSQTKDSITIKSFLSSDTEEIENLIIKMFQNVKLVLSIINDNWGDLPLDQLQSIVYTTIRKLRDHCLRTIHATKYGENKSYDYYDLVTQLEKIAAEWYMIAEDISQRKKAKSELFSVMVTRFNELYECYLKKDLQKANMMWEKHTAESKKHLGTPQSISVLLRQGSTAVHFYYLMKKYTHVASRIVSLCS